MTPDSVTVFLLSHVKRIETRFTLQEQENLLNFKPVILKVTQSCVESKVTKQLSCVLTSVFFPIFIAKRHVATHQPELRNHLSAELYRWPSPPKIQA